NAAMGVVSASGPFSIAIPRGGRPLMMASPTPAARSRSTDSRVRSVRRLSEVTRVPSTSAGTSLAAGDDSMALTAEIESPQCGLYRESFEPARRPYVRRVLDDYPPHPVATSVPRPRRQQLAPTVTDLHPLPYRPRYGLGKTGG